MPPTLHTQRGVIHLIPIFVVIGLLAWGWPWIAGFWASSGSADPSDQTAAFQGNSKVYHVPPPQEPVPGAKEPTLTDQAGQVLDSAQGLVGSVAK